MFVSFIPFTLIPRPINLQFITIAVQCMEPGSIVTSMAAAATLKARALKEIWNVAASVTAEAAPDRKHNGSALL